MRRLSLLMSVSLDGFVARGDEYRLTVHPVALGEGLSLMHGLPEPQRFELVSSTAYRDGSVVQVLRPS